MKQQTDFPEVLCVDEAVCFIADRHDVTPQQLLQYFFQNHLSGNVVPISLEPNEMEILKGLYETVKN